MNELKPRKSWENMGIIASGVENIFESFVVSDIAPKKSGAYNGGWNSIILKNVCFIIKKDDYGKEKVPV